MISGFNHITLSTVSNAQQIVGDDASKLDAILKNGKLPYISFALNEKTDEADFTIEIESLCGISKTVNEISIYGSCFFIRNNTPGFVYFSFNKINESWNFIVLG